MHNSLSSQNSLLQEFAMPLSALPQPRDGAGDGDLVCLLALSVTGLLLNGLALMVQGDDGWLVLSRLALIACAPALAAMAALHFAGHVDEACSRKRMRHS
jgi:hypothetical protein